MIYITGDPHGDFRHIKRFVRENHLGAGDEIIVLGDAGINYFGNSRDVQPRKFISKLPVTLFCIHGNHEMRPETLPSYQPMQHRGGTVYVEPDYPNILFAADGEVFDFDGVRTMVCGGAYSVDKQLRIDRGWSWFADEQPSQQIKDKVEHSLDQLGWKVDVMLTHTSPLSYEPQEVFLPQVDQSTVDDSTERWLDGIERRLDYRYWYCGHFHTQKHVQKLQFMYKDIEPFYGQPGWTGQAPQQEPAIDAPLDDGDEENAV